MKQIQSQSRHNILWTVILCYLFPFIGLSSIGAFMGRAPKNWFLLCIALLLSSIGSLIIYWILAKWESSFRTSENVFVNKAEILPNPVPSPIISEESSAQQISAVPSSEIIAAEKALQELKEVNIQLQSDIGSFVSELQHLEKEKEQSQQCLNKVLADLENYKQTCLQQQEQYKIYINELQDQLAEQKQQAEKKQYQISHLETKVGDLTYEIKTLLKIAERHLESDDTVFGEQNMFSDNSSSSLEESSEFGAEKPISSSESASIQLKRCLDIAQKITGSNRFNTQISSFLDSPADSFTLDLRRLCDTLRSENNSTIVLYSPKENQPLFVNNRIRETTGWSPEKFIQNFGDIIQDSMHEWRQGLSSLALKPETAIQLSLKTKSGPNVTVKAHLAFIPTGIFRHYAIAVLY